MRQVFWFSVLALADIVVFLIVGIVFDLTQIAIVLLFIFFDDKSINASYRGVIGLASLISSI